MTARTDGMDALALPELERRVANTVRFGHIIEVDHAKGLIRVQSGELETDWLPWAAGRAGAGKRTWSAPEVDEQVVLLAPTGDLRQAVAIPGMYQDAHGAPSSDGNVDKTEYGDGTVIQYDRGAHALTADLGASKVYADRTKIELTIGGVVLRLAGGNITLIGNIQHTGNFASSGGTFTHDGNNVGGDHDHGGVTVGSDRTSGPG